jgi:hypothetical protein
LPASIFEWCSSTTSVPGDAALRFFAIGESSRGFLFADAVSGAAVR